MLSPILFCFYMDNLFKLLRDSKNGCWIGDNYAGVFGLLLICPSRSGLQNMLGSAERYANSHKISFSTNINPTKSKTKGIIFTNKETKADPEPVLLNGNPLPWVKSGKYHGKKLTGIQNGYQQDVKEKRARYIERNCELNQEFPFAHPSVKCHLNRLYNSSFYGSSLWDLTGDMTKQVVNSWSVSVRHMWDLPLSTHRNLIEPLSGTHAETMLLSRYAMFIQSLRKTSRVAVQFLLQLVSKDMNTVTGRNIRHVLTKSNSQDIFSMNVKKFKENHEFAPLPPDQKWKPQFIKELTDLKIGCAQLLSEFGIDDETNGEETNGDEANDDEGNVDSLTMKEIDEILVYICTS